MALVALDSNELSSTCMTLLACIVSDLVECLVVHLGSLLVLDTVNVTCRVVIRRYHVVKILLFHLTFLFKTLCLSCSVYLS